MPSLSSLPSEKISNMLSLRKYLWGTVEETILTSNPDCFLRFSPFIHPSFTLSFEIYLELEVKPCSSYSFLLYCYSSDTKFKKHVAKNTGQMWVQDMKSILLIVRKLTRNSENSDTQITTRYAQETNKIPRTGRNSGEILTFSVWFLEKTWLKPMCCVSE